ncbi:MAG: YraN family protein [Nitrospirae bacterium]|nr:YraN family protein [Nitrospirota bacterium]
MTMKSLEYGREAETYAASYLKQKGYKIVEKNYKTRFGEIDLIATDRNTLVFLEIKARQNDHFGGPAGAVTRTKRQKIVKMAKFYLMSKKIERDIRFDVLLIVGALESPSVELIQNAFDGES